MAWEARRKIVLQHPPRQIFLIGDHNAQKARFRGLIGWRAFNGAIEGRNIGPSQREFYEGNTPDLDLLAHEAFGARLLVKADSRILFKHPHDHAGVISPNQSLGDGAQEILSNATALYFFEKINRIELCVKGGDWFTNGTASGEPDDFAFKLSYKNADVPGEPFPPNANAIGLTQGSQVFCRNQSLIRSQPALHVHVRYCGCIPHLGKPDGSHAHTCSVSWGTIQA
jgi:hypothetical protein